MLNLFSDRNAAKKAVETIDVNLVAERIAESLAEAGLDPDSRAFASMFKMIVDDVTWAVDNFDDVA